MLGLRLAPRLFIISLATITLILMSASMMAAQTPTASVEKAAVESNATAPESASKNPTAPSAASSTVAKEETEKIPAATVKTETEPVKESTAAPSAAPAAPQVIAPCPPGTRMIKADVVAIPQALMLNRLGATIPNGFVFALRSDTIKTGLGNIQLRPGKRPRPIVLRANVGDCLRVSFQNAIPAANFGPQAATPQSPAIATTEVSLHIQGQEWALGTSRRWIDCGQERFQSR